MTSSSTAAPAEAPEFQTRYSFYDAKDYQTKKDPDDDDVDDDDDESPPLQQTKKDALSVVSETADQADKYSIDESKQPDEESIQNLTSPSSAQEILKSLQETEQQTSSSIWNPPPPLTIHERNVSQVSQIANTGAASDDEEEEENNAATARELLLNASHMDPMEAHERAIREALYWVRVRSQRRARLFQQRSDGVVSSKATPVGTAVGDVEQQPSVEGNVKEPNGDFSTTTSGGVNLIKTELGRVSTSGSQSTILPNSSNHVVAVPPPVSTPNPKNNHHKPPLVVTATELENQLLSPAADVRKAVEGSTPELFRGGGASPSNKDGIQGEGLLELANPILSQQDSSNSLLRTPGRTNIHGNGGVPHTPTTTNRTEPALGSEVPPPAPPTTSSLSFSVVPSSPAPHHAHFGTTPTTGGIMGNTPGPDGSILLSNGGGTNTNTGPTELETAEMRRTRLELERQWRLEEEIERGVEQVLMAILEKATANTLKTEGGGGVLDPSVVDRSGLGKDGDWIQMAFSNLFAQENGGGVGGAGGGSIAPTMRLARVASTEEGEKNITKEKELNAVQTSGKSIVDELLAEPDTTDDFDEPSVNLAGGAEEKSSIVETEGAPQAPTELNDSLLSLTISSDPERDDYEDSTSIRPFTNAYDEILEVEAVEKRSPQSFTNEESFIEDASKDYESQEKALNGDQENEYNGMVLGPLSKEVGGTTGVVLQNENDEEDIDPVEDVLSAHKSASGLMDASADSQDPNDEKKSQSIIESITHAVRKGPGDIIAALSGDSTSLVASPTSTNSQNSDNQLGVSKSSALLIRHLYAHILPVTPGAPKRKKTHKKSSSFSTWFSDYVIGQNMSHAPMHEWDDDDPDEPGYTIHTLSRAQLQHIEHQFESMMTHFDQRPKSSELSRSPLSKDLEDDLKEAENLLSEPVKKEIIPVQKKKPQRKNSVKKGTPVGRSTPTRKSGSKQRGKVANPLASNPCFPSAKPAGTGEVGDLELYHLPIIYKANQTGFEPTKDLVLQPDTVFAGKYYVQSELGSAAFSTAYRCVDLNSGKKGDDGEMVSF